MNYKYQKVTQQLRDYAQQRLIVHPASEEELTIAEKSLGVKLPESYRRFQLEFGSFEGTAVDVWSVGKPATSWGRNIVGYTKSERSGGAIDSCNPFLPDHLIAVGETYRGNPYCLDTSKYRDDECPVVLWDHDKDNYQTPKVVADDFLDWLEQEIEEAKNDVA